MRQALRSMRSQSSGCDAYMEICRAMDRAPNDGGRRVIREAILSSTSIGLRSDVPSALLAALGMEPPKGCIRACQQDVCGWTNPLTAAFVGKA